MILKGKLTKDTLDAVYLDIGATAPDRSREIWLEPFLVGIVYASGQGGNTLARPNFQSNKRHKELTRKKKKEQKRQRKQDKNTAKSAEESPIQPVNEEENTAENAEEKADA